LKRPAIAPIAPRPYHTDEKPCPHSVEWRSFYGSNVTLRRPAANRCRVIGEDGTRIRELKRPVK
jgi:hypothetical protein